MLDVRCYCIIYYYILLDQSEDSILWGSEGNFNPYRHEIPSHALSEVATIDNCEKNTIS